MISEPWFWHQETMAARIVTKALAPAAYLYDTGQRLRAGIANPAELDTPLLCIGNATLGGVGKTPTALAIEKLLAPLATVAFLSRGYKGSLKGPVKVNPMAHCANDVGDEALLLARRAQTIVAKDRAQGARHASNQGCDIIIMDDGFQNPTVSKSFSLLLVPSEILKKKKAIFPAGPMREPLMRACERADAIGIVGAQKINNLNFGRPTFEMTLQPLDNQNPGRVLAFCGIGNPNRFFQMLQDNGYDVADQVAFPDHAQISTAVFSDLEKRAKSMGARLITTEKDCIRLEPELRDGVGVFKVEMKIKNANNFVALIKAKTGLGQS